MYLSSGDGTALEQPKSASKRLQERAVWDQAARGLGVFARLARELGGLQ